jgi:ankyrin repeat protein
MRECGVPSHLTGRSDVPQTNGATATFMAAQNGHVAVLEKLAAAGADVNKADVSSSLALGV